MLCDSRARSLLGKSGTAAPIAMRTRTDRMFWSVPYPQEINDIPLIVARKMDAKDFAQIIVDQLHEMLVQTKSAKAPALVMGIALHPYIIGQPYRLLHLRKVLEKVTAARDLGKV